MSVKRLKAPQSLVELHITLRVVIWFIVIAALTMTLHHDLIVLQLKHFYTNPEEL